MSEQIEILANQNLGAETAPPDDDLEHHEYNIEWDSQ